MDNKANELLALLDPAAIVGAADVEVYDAPTLEDLGACPGRRDKLVYERCYTGVFGGNDCKCCGRKVW